MFIVFRVTAIPHDSSLSKCPKERQSHPIYLMRVSASAGQGHFCAIRPFQEESGLGFSLHNQATFFSFATKISVQILSNP